MDKCLERKKYYFCSYKDSLLPVLQCNLFNSNLPLNIRTTIGIDFIIDGFFYSF